MVNHVTSNSFNHNTTSSPFNKYSMTSVKSSNPFTSDKVINLEYVISSINISFTGIPPMILDFLMDCLCPLLIR